MTYHAVPEHDRYLKDRVAQEREADLRRPQWVMALLEALANGATMTEAMWSAGVSWTKVSNRLSDDHEFEEAVDLARDGVVHYREDCKEEFDR